LTLVFLLIIAGVIYYFFIYKGSYKTMLFSSDNKKCPNCQNPVEPDFNVCPVCKETLKRKCNNCGASVDVTWKYCPYCETSLRKGDNVETKNRI
jgi:RNA polymerase subunit RPABC4/transcription elongation factor Spt4